MKKAIKLALGIVIVAASAASVNAAETNQSLTREEVRADLAMWTRAGLDAYPDSITADVIFTAEYRDRYATYLKLRNGPEFNAEVERLRAEKN